MYYRYTMLSLFFRFAIEIDSETLTKMQLILLKVVGRQPTEIFVPVLFEEVGLFLDQYFSFYLLMFRLFVLINVLA